MLDMDHIETVSGPTSWVSPIVIVPKPGQQNKLRIFKDARLHNQAKDSYLVREHHIRKLTK